MPWITTKNGKRINTDWFDDDAKQKERQIKANEEEGKKKNEPEKKKASNVPKKQMEWEDKMRSEPIEHLGYFDKDGNILFETTGTKDDVTFGTKYEDSDDWDKVIAFNHNVEQKVWQDVEIYGTHNHPENTIFSPEDVHGFESLENKSMSAVLPNGTNYRLIREQPRTSNAIIIDMNTGESHREFEPKKIAQAYEEEYARLYDDDYEKMRRTTTYGSPERARAIEELDKKVARGMEKWLNANAKSYGYRFIKETK